MSRLRIGTSFWLDRYRGHPPRFAKLSGHHNADVAVVGGGVTGCACAYLLARAGARVVLVESRHVGRGSTAASTALLMQEPDVDFGDLAVRYGRPAARNIWQQSRRAVQAFVRILRQLRVKADLHLLPSVYFSRDAEVARALRRELLFRRRSGIRGRWLPSAGLKSITGIDGAGAILTQGNAQVDPYRACIGLARGALDAGAAVFAHSHVNRIRTSPGGVCLELTRGRVSAPHVIIATGYATPELKQLVGRFRMLNTYVVTTPRLSTGIREEMGLGDVMCWDTERPYHYARWTPDRRLLFGGQDRPYRPGRSRRDAVEQRAESLSAELAELYPALQHIRPEYAWEGLFATTPDGLPYIGSHRRYPRHLFALGYGGNGMTFGFLAAQILERTLLGRRTAADELFAFGRHR